MDFHCLLGRHTTRSKTDRLNNRKFRNADAAGKQKACAKQEGVSMHRVLLNAKAQPRGPSEDGVSDASESPEDGRLPALRCGDFFFIGRCRLSDRTPT